MNHEKRNYQRTFWICFFLYFGTCLVRVTVTSSKQLYSLNTLQTQITFYNNQIAVQMTFFLLEVVIFPTHTPPPPPELLRFDDSEQ